MLEVHLATLHREASRASSHASDLGAPALDDLTEHISDLRYARAWDLVAVAFQARYGYRVEFLLHRSAATGRLDPEDVDSALYRLDAGDLTDLAIQLRTDADARDWNQLLLTLQQAPDAERQALLDDGATLVYLREAAPAEVVWDATWAALHGHLDVAVLLSDETALQDWLEWVGTAVWWTDACRALVDDNPLESVFGVNEEEFRYDWDLAALQQAGRAGLSDDARDRAAPAELMDPDLQRHLDATDGRGRDRREAELDLLYGDADSPLVAVDRARGPKAMRVALLELSDDDRAVLQADSAFLLRLHAMAEGGASEELFALLLDGPEAADARRLHATGDGVNGRWFDAPWEAVDALATLSADARAEISLDPTRRKEWLIATAADRSAQFQVRALLDHTDTDTAADLDDLVVRHRGRILAALHGDASTREAELLDRVAALVEEARGLLEADSTRRDALDRAMAAVHAGVMGEIRARFADGGGPVQHVEAALTGWRTATRAGITPSSVRTLRHYAEHDDTSAVDAAVRSMSERDFARSMTSLVESGVGGVRPLQEAYRDFLDVEAEAEAAPDPDSANRILQAARVALVEHPVDAAADVGQGDHQALADLSLSTERALLASVRARIRSLPGAVVADVVHVRDPDHVDLVWGPRRTVDLQVREARQDAQRGLADRVGVGLLTDADDEGHVRYGELAQLYERALADEELSEADAARIGDLVEDLGVSVAEFRAVKSRVADTVSAMAAVAIGSVITAATGGAAAPVWAGILSTALAGGVSILIHEAVEGEDHDAHAALAELAVEVLSQALAAHLTQLWGQARGAVHASILRASKGRQLLEARAAFDVVARRYLGTLGVDLVGAAAEQVQSDLQDVAFQLLDPTLYEHGWDDGLEQAMGLLEAELAGMDDAVLDALLAQLAESAGEAAGDLIPSDGELSARQVAMDRPSDPRTEPRAYGEFLKKRLGKVPGVVVEEGVSTAVEGLVERGLTEGREFVVTGDVEVDVDALARVLADSGLQAAKEGGSGVSGAVTGARADVRSERQHVERMTALREWGEHGLTDEDLVEFAAWSKTQRSSRDPARDGLGTAKADEREAGLELEVAAFRRHQSQVDGQLAARHEAWSGTLSEEQLDTWESWVRERPDPTGERLGTSPEVFAARRAEAERTLAQTRESAGYRALTEHERAWYEHASADPSRMVDLTQASGELTVDVRTPAGAERFGAGLRALERKEALRVLREAVAGLDEETQALTTAHEAEIAAQVRMSPTDAAGNREALLRALEAR